MMSADKAGKECRNEKCLHRKQISSKAALARKYAAMDLVSCQKCPENKA